MPPIYDWYCTPCQVEDLSRITKLNEVPLCPKCLEEMTKGISTPGGYQIKGDNGASRRPTQAGSFKGKIK